MPPSSVGASFTRDREIAPTVHENPFLVRPDFGVFMIHASRFRLMYTSNLEQGGAPSHPKLDAIPLPQRLTALKKRVILGDVIRKQPEL